MDRLGFIKTCGLACLGAGYAISFLEGCGASKRIIAEMQASDLVVPLNAFAVEGKKGTKYLPAIIADHSQLKDPVCVMRSEDGQTYGAVLMRCTHQGAQLQLFGDKLQCPAHGSEFNLQGTVLQGPANAALRTLKTRVQDNNILISLQ